MGDLGGMAPQRNPQAANTEPQTSCYKFWIKSFLLPIVQQRDYVEQL